MTQTIIIDPHKIFSLAEIRAVWTYRELLYFFVWRNLKVRYKQTFIGVLWALFQPAISMVIFTLFFSRLIGSLPGDVPYPVFVYVGLIFWQFFSTSLSDISESLIVNKDIITKVYFPRLILPIADIVTRLVDALVASTLLVALLIYYSVVPGLLSIVILPLLYILTAVAALGSGLVLSGLNVRYRDVRYILPFLIQLTLFLTPVIYPAQSGSAYTTFLVINPLTGIVHAARASLLQSTPFNWSELGISFVISLLLLIAGYWYFRRTEQLVADVI